MDFDWINVPADLSAVNPKEIEESFEDPFSIRLLPDIYDMAASEARYFILGKSVSGRGLFTVFWTDGKRYRGDSVPGDDGSRECLLRSQERGDDELSYESFEQMERVAPVLGRGGRGGLLEGDFPDSRLMNGSMLKTDNRDSITITLRFDPRMLARIKRLARSRVS